VKSIFLKKSILIVDDDPVSALLFKEFLEPTKAKIFVVYDGNSVFKIIKDQDIDLILLDIRLGDYSGFELLPKIREINPEIIVIAQTANAMIDDFTKCMEAGFDDYISKPIMSKELFLKLEKHLMTGT
jgi:CheY-like chemotaxis protein